MERVNQKAAKIGKETKSLRFGNPHKNKKRPAGSSSRAGNFQITSCLPRTSEVGVWKVGMLA